MKKILILTRDQDKFKKEILNLNLDKAKLLAPKNENEIKEDIKEAEIIIGTPWIIVRYLNEAKKIKWVQSTFTGVDAFVLTENIRKNYKLTNVRNLYGEIISEYVFSYILGIEKEIFENREKQKKKIWDQKPYKSIKSKKIGIMGTGSVGSCIAKISKAFGLEVYGFDTTKNKKEYFDKIHTKETTNIFLKDIDYLVSTLPNTKETKGIINKNVFDKMKKESIIINVGRGENINEKDLIEAIEKREISKAILDVFTQEPLSKSSKIWENENIYVTPHISGYNIDNSKVLETFKENYIRYNNNKKLLYEIDFNKGY